MTPQGILTKAIQKAISCGYQWPYDKDYLRFNFSGDDNDLSLWNGGEYEDATLLHHKELIFNHDFAKAIWPAKLIKVSVTHHTSDMTHPGVRSVIEGWQYHLQQMVIAEDPIAYLGNNLPS